MLVLNIIPVDGKARKPLTTAIARGQKDGVLAESSGTAKPPNNGHFFYCRSFAFMSCFFSPNLIHLMGRSLQLPPRRTKKSGIFLLSSDCVNLHRLINFQMRFS